MSRIIGSNSHGVKNELNIVNALKNKYFSMLNNNLKEFIKFIASENNILIDHNTIIDAEYEPNNLLKQDFYIIIDRDYAISCKMGNGNSVHQEKCEDFIKYIKEELFASDDICDKFRFFIWSDGTLDGSGSKEIDEYGNIKSRFTAKEFRERYPEKSRILQNFLDKNEEVLIRRFLFVGRHNSKIDYIYHGNEFDGYWVSANDIMKANMGENKHIKGLHVGKMSLQSWNISKKGNTEHKRGQLQVKYPQMKNDLYAIMRTSAININTFFGDKEEYNLSREFNKNKNATIWKDLLKNIENIQDIYMVKATNKVFSQLSKKNVLPKTDNYLVQVPLSHDFLLAKGYELTEKDLINRDHTIIKNSGISVKMAGSKNYTVQKLTRNSFVKAFKDILKEPLLFFLALLLYSNEEEKNKNQIMMGNMGIEKNEFISFFEHKMNKKIDSENVNDLLEIRRFAQIKVKEVIKCNPRIYSSLMTGSDWFDEPYVAHYIYLNKIIMPNELVDFTITNGSGRSKGKYSIEIKPIINK